METAELQDKIFEYMQKMKGKKKLKEKDIIKQISADTGEDKDTVKKALRAMIDVGKLMYSYGGGASSVEIPSEEYLREKGLLK
jgi:predicted RNA-binding protein (virulence factor B family)